jgi:hypothetical protein
MCILIEQVGKMIQGGLFPQTDSRKPIPRYPLGKGLTLEIDGGSQGRCNLLRYDEPIKSVKLSDKVARKLLVIEAVELGAKPTHPWLKPWGSVVKRSITTARPISILDWRG